MQIWQEKDKMAFLAAIKGLRDKDKAKEKAWDLADSAEFQCRLGGISQNRQLEARRKKTKKSSSSRSPSVRKAPICFRSKMEKRAWFAVKQLSQLEGRGRTP